MKYYILTGVIVFFVAAIIILIVLIVRINRKKMGMGNPYIKDIDIEYVNGTDTVTGEYNSKNTGKLGPTGLGTIIVSKGRAIYISLVDADRSIKYLKKELFRGEIILGSVYGNSNIKIANDNTVSRNHCKIFPRNMLPYIMDMGSSNGTYVNGKRINSGIPLKNNDIISIGQTNILVKIKEG